MSTAPDFPPVDEQLAKIRRGAHEVFPEDELVDKLRRSRESGRPLRVKLGVDPTAPDITLGNAVPLWKLRTFQDLGHTVVMIIGDYTARVGDPSGRNELRPLLSEDEVDAYAQTYLDQLHHILREDRLEVRRNGEWFREMSFMDVMRLAGRKTVAQMIERDDFARRFAAGDPISIHEFLYPLMQGWDSVEVRADVELGGTDQRFNLLVGREFQRQEGQEPQAVVTNPLLPGTDGSKKMSKSAGNYIGITEPPTEQFGKAMSVPDALVRDWLLHFTDVPDDAIEELCDGERTHPMEAKKALAAAIVERYHGADAAREAREHFERVFSRREVPAEMPELTVPQGGVGLLAFLADHGLAGSRGEARRLVQQGAVRLDDERVGDVGLHLDPDDGTVLRVGKRRFARLRRS